MTVRELIKELLDYNQDAIVFVGDNLYNPRIMLRQFRRLHKEEL